MGKHKEKARGRKSRERKLVRQTQANAKAKQPLLSLSLPSLYFVRKIKRAAAHLVISKKAK